ncbi:hypothetical protein DL764_005135 [Monosporascus ibericus]|uniref:Uncharacterized protein n=1 Tax=Monosporascus ibericus TaxID=155417 RepID=A0A4Q4TCW6_9PEZI|nr:hypothetical protein DL764_005135 [Monosporascus ibericus]
MFSFSLAATTSPDPTSNTAMDNIREVLRTMGVLESSIPVSLPSVISVPVSNQERAQARFAFAKLGASDAWGKPDLFALRPATPVADIEILMIRRKLDDDTWVVHAWHPRQIPVLRVPLRDEAAVRHAKSSGLYEDMAVRMPVESAISAWVLAHVVYCEPDVGDLKTGDIIAGEAAKPLVPALRKPNQPRPLLSG